MAKIGEDKTQKKLSVDRVRKLPRKIGGRFTVRSKPGAHNKHNSVPLGFAVRDMLGIARTAKEANAVLNSKAIKVNGIVRSDYRFNLGLFDVLETGENKQRFRAVFDSHGRLVLAEIHAKAELGKLCKVTKKQTIRGGMVQLTANDGSTFVEKKTGVKVGDTVKLTMPDRKITDVYAMKKGSLAYITSGKHAGTMARITNILQGTMSRPKLVALDTGGKGFMTIDRNVFVVGEKKPAIEIGAGGAVAGGTAAGGADADVGSKGGGKK